jgi:hypothetical protein
VETKKVLLLIAEKRRYSSEMADDVPRCGLAACTEPGRWGSFQN